MLHRINYYRCHESSRLPFEFILGFSYSCKPDVNDMFVGCRNPLRYKYPLSRKIILVANPVSLSNSCLVADILSITDGSVALIFEQLELSLILNPGHSNFFDLLDEAPSSLRLPKDNFTALRV